MAHAEQIIHSRPRSTHQWYLTICLKLPPRLILWQRRNQCPLSLASRWQLTNTSAFVTNHLPATCFLRDPKRWKSLCPILQTTPVTGYSITAGRMHLLHSPDLITSNFHPFGPLLKQPAGDKFATTQMWSKLPHHVYINLTLVSSMPGYKPWSHCGINA
jgi:hypothetical protein